MPGLTASRTPTTTTHTRHHASVLADLERRVLVWLATRLPRQVTSDGLTYLGAAGMLGAGCALAAASESRTWLALVPVFLAINWFGDSLDGTARAGTRRTASPLRLLPRSRRGPGEHARAVRGPRRVRHRQPLRRGGSARGYLLLAAESFLATHALGVFRISFAGFGPTELRILLSIGAIAAIGRPVVTPFGLGEVRLWDVGGLCGIVGMVTVFAINAVRNARALSAGGPDCRAARS